jgi:hypothetical protein
MNSCERKEGRMKGRRKEDDERKRKENERKMVEGRWWAKGVTYIHVVSSKSTIDSRHHGWNYRYVHSVHQKPKNGINLKKNIEEEGTI